jgi:ABC-2 type transport system permease protein
LFPDTLPFAIYRQSPRSLSLILDNLVVMRGAFRQQWRALRSEGADWLEIVNMLPMVIVIAWIGSQSGRLPIMTYLALGIFFVVLLDRAHLGLRYAITDEAQMGTLDFTLLSPAPLMAVILGKAVAQTLSAARPALGAFVVGLIVTGGVGDVASIPWAIISTVVALVSLSAVAIAEAPGTVLAGEQLGAIRSTRSILTALSGFLYPVSMLPGPLQALARLFPTSWAMEGLIGAIEVGPSTATFLNLAAAGALSAAYFIFAAWMFTKVEARVRAIGRLRA